MTPPEHRILVKAAVFSELRPHELQLLAQAMRPVTLREGALLVEEGALEATMYLVLTGRLDVRVRVANQPTTICTLWPGDVAGELSVVDPAPRSASLVATVDSTLLALDREVIARLWQQAPHVGRRLLAGLTGVIERRLSETNRRLRSATEQMAARELAAYYAVAETPTARAPQRLPHSEALSACTVGHSGEFLSRDTLHHVLSLCGLWRWEAGSALQFEEADGALCPVLIVDGWADRVAIARRSAFRVGSLAAGEIARPSGATAAAGVELSTMARTPVVGIPLSAALRSRLAHGRSGLGATVAVYLARAAAREVRSTTQTLAELRVRQDEVAAASKRESRAVRERLRRRQRAVEAATKRPQPSARKAPVDIQIYVPPGQISAAEVRMRSAR